jgi:nucleotidyltransferase substrate binding protein (TIGR01987 family)
MSPVLQQRADLTRVIGRWGEALTAWQAHGSDRDRDSAILRFELAYEVAWKHLQALAREQGFESVGPRQAFENAFRLGWIEDEVVWRDVLTARNQAVHVYREAWAQALAERLPVLQAAFVRLLERLPVVGPCPE